MSRGRSNSVIRRITGEYRQRMKSSRRPPHRPAWTADGQMLKRLPKPAEALHRSGLIKAQTGALTDGTGRKRQTVKASPRQQIFHANPCRLLGTAGKPRALVVGRLPPRAPGGTSTSLMSPAQAEF